MIVTPPLAAQIPETARIRLGRVIRHIVDDTLRYGDGSGEATARAAFDALADKLDPEQAEALVDAAKLLKDAEARLQGEADARAKVSAQIVEAQQASTRAERGAHS